MTYKNNRELRKMIVNEQCQQDLQIIVNQAGMKGALPALLNTQQNSELEATCAHDKAK